MDARHGVRRLVSDSAVYGLVSAASALASVVMVPVYTRHFAPSEYGVLGLLAALVTLLSILVVLSLDSAAQRWFQASRSDSERLTTFASWVWCQLAVAATLAASLICAADPISRELLGSAKYAGVLRMGIASVPLATLATTTSNWLRFQRRPWAMVGLTLTTTCVSMGSTLLFLEVGHVGLLSPPLGLVTGNAAGSLVALAILRGSFHPRRINTAVLTAMLRYALPLVPATMGIWVVNLLDRYLVGAFGGTGQVGLYQAANQIAAIVGIGVTAFQLAWGPFAFSHVDDPGGKRLYARVMLLFVVSAGAACALIGVFAPELLRVAATVRYVGAATAVPWLAFSFIGVGLLSVAAIGPSIVGRTGLIAGATLFGAVVTVALDVALIPVLGGLGAGIATCASWTAVAGFLFVRAQPTYRVPYPFAAATAVGVFDLAVSVALERLAVGGTAVTVCVKIVLLTTSVGPVTWWAVRHAITPGRSEAERLATDPAVASAIPAIASNALAADSLAAGR